LVSATSFLYRLLRQQCEYRQACSLKSNKEISDMDFPLIRFFKKLDMNFLEA
jgi:hypothetical protein